MKYIQKLLKLAIAEDITGQYRKADNITHYLKLAAHGTPMNEMQYQQMLDQLMNADTSHLDDIPEPGISDMLDAEMFEKNNSQGEFNQLKNKPHMTAQELEEMKYHQSLMRGDKYAPDQDNDRLRGILDMPDETHPDNNRLRALLGE